uniref:Uncharacterized protein n=1 Tax=Amazona collaria TaxID=241587 RepID=A0A8B9F870_9PSIT
SQLGGVSVVSISGLTFSPLSPSPRWVPAAARPGHGHRRPGRNPPGRAGRGHGMDTDLLPFHPLDAGISLGRKHRSWSRCCQQGLDGAQHPPAPAGWATPWPCHLPCPLWVLQVRVCPGEGETKREHEGC